MLKESQWTAWRRVEIEEERKMKTEVQAVSKSDMVEGLLLNISIQ